MVNPVFIFWVPVPLHDLVAALSLSITITACRCCLAHSKVVSTNLFCTLAVKVLKLHELDGSHLSSLSLLLEVMDESFSYDIEQVSNLESHFLIVKA